jgi:dCTP diphosphatase
MHGSYAYSTYIAIYYLFSIVKKTNISLNNKGEIMNFEKIKSDIDKFVSNRKWQDYHTPKNLSMALSVEASELMEIFQWQMENEKEYPKSASKEQVEDEVADVFFYLVRFCQIMNIDLEKAFYYKMKKNAEKYPNQIK